MKVIIAGDYCPQDRVSGFIQYGNFEAIFGEVKQVLKGVDYSIVNLECPLANDKTLPIKKKGPCLKCSREGVDAIEWAGFKCVTLANNHFRDYGNEGVKATIDYLDERSIDHVGGGRNITQASAVFYKDIKGKRLAIINCCEHEFSIATDEMGGSNPLNPIQQYYSIQEARKEADYILVVVHGGHEHFQLPSPRMQDTYRFFVDVGADAVINHHQHCYSGYEVYKGKPIFYGLGNFCFDNGKYRRNNWNYGYMVTLDFEETGINYSMHPYIQCDDEPGIKLLPDGTFTKKLSELNSIIQSKVSLSEAVKAYYDKTGILLGDILEPIRNRYYLSSKHRGWMPSLISKERIIAATNFICCESHRDKLINWLLNNNH